MKNKTSHYPFVEPFLAKQINKKGFNRSSCTSVYEQAYTNENGKRIKPKLFRPGLQIKETMELLSNSKMKEEYDKRPGMFGYTNGIIQTLPPWVYWAPTYQEVIDWLREEYTIVVTIEHNPLTLEFWCKIYYGPIYSRKTKETYHCKSYKEALFHCLKLIFKCQTVFFADLEIGVYKF